VIYFIYLDFFPWENDIDSYLFENKPRLQNKTREMIMVFESVSFQMIAMKSLW